MNTIRITMLAATLCVAGLAGSAQAQDAQAALHGEDGGAFYFSQQPWVSTLTRAEVIARMLAARESGETVALNSEDGGSFHMSQRPFESVLTRAEVIAEMMAARESGEMDALHSEDGGSFYYAQHGSPDAAAFARRTAARQLASHDEAAWAP